MRGYISPNLSSACQGKIKYRTYHEAKKSLKKVRQHGRRRAKIKVEDSYAKFGGKVSIYMCSSCGYWHTGHDHILAPRPYRRKRKIDPRIV